MKKFLLMAAMVAAGLSSCSKNEVFTNQTSDSAINFGTYTSIATKGTETTATSLQGTDGESGFSAGDGIGVYGFMQGSLTLFSTNSIAPNVFFNKELYGVGTGDDYWTYDDTKYWNSETSTLYSFFAYGPYSDGTNVTTSSTSSATGVPSVNVSLAAKPEDMVDFVAGQTLNIDKYGNVYTSGESGVTSSTSVSNVAKVDLDLKHQLTRVSFKVKFRDGVDASTYACIKSLKILGTAPTFGANYLPSGVSQGASYLDSNNVYGSDIFYASGVYTFNDATTDETETEHAQDGTWTLGSPVEDNYDLNSILNTPTSNTNALAAYATNYVASSTNYVFTNGGGLAVDGTAPETTAVSLFQDGQYVFLLPLASTGIGESETIQIELIYDIFTLDSSIATGYADPSTVNSYAYASLNVGTLQQGKAYEYTITINGQGLKNPSVENPTNPSTEELDAIELYGTVVTWDVDTTTASNLTVGEVEE